MSLCLAPSVSISQSCIMVRPLFAYCSLHYRGGTVHTTFIKGYMTCPISEFLDRWLDQSTYVLYGDRAAATGRTSDANFFRSRGSTPHAASINCHAISHARSLHALTASNRGGLVGLDHQKDKARIATATTCRLLIRRPV